MLHEAWPPAAPAASETPIRQSQELPSGFQLIQLHMPVADRQLALLTTCNHELRNADTLLLLCSMQHGLQHSMPGRSGMLKSAGHVFPITVVRNSIMFFCEAWLHDLIWRGDVASAGQKEKIFPITQLIPDDSQSRSHNVHSRQRPSIERKSQTLARQFPLPAFVVLLTKYVAFKIDLQSRCIVGGHTRTPEIQENFAIRTKTTCMPTLLQTKFSFVNQFENRCWRCIIFQVSSTRHKCR